MVTENQKPQPRILIQGKILEIGLSITKADMVTRREGDDQPVAITYEGRNGKFINIFDHRAATVAAWAQYQVDHDKDRLDAAFAACPCLGRMAEKTSQYIVLTDMGVEDMWQEGDEEELILTRGGEFDRKNFFVPNEAIHPATSICFIAPRPPEPEKSEEVDSVDTAIDFGSRRPINPQMAELLAGVVVTQ